MVTIAGRVIGTGEQCFVVAEAGVNHNGDVELALELVRAAADAGADAVKFQSFRAEGVATAAAEKTPYQRTTTGGEGSQLELLRRLELSADAHRAIVAACEGSGIVFLSTPFDEESADLLEGLDVAAFKLASPDVTNTPFLRYVAAKQRPVLLSTGMSTLAEVEAALAALREGGASEVVLLHCVSAYPAPTAEANLRAIRTMSDRLGVPVGWSDHTLDAEAAIAAVALGAAVVEKHLTLDRTLPGPDHAASLEPREFQELVASIRRVEAALGDGEKRPVPSEEPNRDLVRRSVAVRRDLAAGTVLEAAMLTALRPGTGIAPTRLPELVGRRLRAAVGAGELLRTDDLE